MGSFQVPAKICRSPSLRVSQEPGRLFSKAMAREEVWKLAKSQNVENLGEREARLTPY